MDNMEQEESKTFEISEPRVEVDSLMRELVELRDSVSKQEESIQVYLEQIKRLQADFENWRKRVEQEKSFLIENASSTFVEKLLPVLDNFERALAAPENSKGDSAFKKGMDLIYRQFIDLLKEEGLTTIETVGQTFDPTQHEAYSYEERKSGEDHEVLEEARKGYLFKGRVLRPALVKVSKVTESQEVEKKNV